MIALLKPNSLLLLYMDRIALALLLSIVTMVLMVDWSVINTFIVPQTEEQLTKNSVQRGFLLSLTTHALLITICMILLSRKAVILRTGDTFGRV